MSLRLVLLAVLLVSACGSTPPPPLPPEPVAVFPVTVKHVFGETTVPKKPERVVALGFGDVAVANRLEAYIAGAVRYPEADGPNLPYVDAQLSKEVLALDAGQFDAAKIASFEPDLILVTSVDLDAARYAELSKLAPTVARGEKSTMDADAELIGQVVGNPAGARKLIDLSHAQLDTFRQELPKLPGKTYAYAEPLPFLDSLGMTRTDGQADVRVDLKPSVIQLLRAPNVAGVEWVLEQVKPMLRQVS